MSNYGITFNSIDFEDFVPGLKVVSNDPYRDPNTKLTSQQIAREDLSTVTSRFYTDKKQTISVEIGRDTRAQLMASIDKLKQMLQAIEAPLVVPQGAANRQYTATKSNMTYKNAQGGHIEIDIEFFCSNPFGYDTTPTVLYNYPALVGGLYDFRCTFEGSAEVQKPVITITINSVSANTNGLISIMNQDKGQTLEITRNWVAADVLVIDCGADGEPSVKVNGVEVDFEGPIPDWDLGVGDVTYTDDFSARNFAIEIEYNKRYI